MKIESVDFFYLSMPVVTDAGDGSQDALVVRVRAGDRVLVRYNDGKSGYLAQSVQPLYIGLGDASRVDRIEVDWPSGQRQTVTRGLKVNGTVRINEPR